MNLNQTKLEAIPTNIITGFLGVGKTSAIIHLLKHKPKNERWAILVNEFGEIGVDGSFFQGQHSLNRDVFLREVPGGCMCCVAGLPMQIALNQLLSQAKPGRLLIEPTGLGHPEEIIQVLTSDHYENVICLEKTITLVDARKLSLERYTKNETFLQQIAIADLVIGNKLDLYNDQDRKRLTSFVKQNGQSHAKVEFTQNGQINIAQLNGATARIASSSNNHIHHAKPAQLAADIPIPNCGFVKATNKGDGFKSIGWRFSPDKEFNHKKLLTFLTGIQAERMKAVFITSDGIFGYNLTSDALTEIELDDCAESRIEVISESIDDSLESGLFACLCD